jgi:hypothetical protein
VSSSGTSFWRDFCTTSAPFPPASGWSCCTASEKRT